MNSCANLRVILGVVLFVGIAYSVPHEFCLDSFDDSDCDAPPTLVFYYYKPGSRCEMRTWRGCPTLNKFPDEFECSHFCIGRNWRTYEGDDVAIPEKQTTEENWIEDLEELDIEEIKVIDKILDEVIPANRTIHKLSYVKTTVPPKSEAITEATTEPAASGAPVVAAEPAAETTKAPAVETTEAPAPETTTVPEATTTVAPAADEEEGSAESVITTL